MQTQNQETEDPSSEPRPSDNKTDHNASVAAAPATNDVQPTMSKNQMKKQRRLERIMQFKAEKRKRERELRKQKGKNNMAVMETSDGETVEIRRKVLKKNLMANSNNKQRVVIDCSFESLMNVSDLSHLGKQLTYCYAINRRMTAPLQFYLTSCSGNNFTIECYKFRLN